MTRWVCRRAPYPSVKLTMQSSNEPITFSVVPAVTTPSEPENWLKASLTSGIGAEIQFALKYYF
ncbi:MAG: hypothetical protein WD733_19805 [Bryobacterales bacterium]